MAASRRKIILKTIRKSVLFILLAYFIPKVMIFYCVCGFFDIKRNDALSLKTINRYFLGNGLLTWLLSPLNLAIDLLCYRNRGTYRITDLPLEYQEEIQRILQLATSQQEQIIELLSKKMEAKEKGMIFFEWYGKRIRDFFGVNLADHHFKLIKTVGVSVFNKNQSTSEHFGPLRATLRVLYNLTPTNTSEVYIKVGPEKHVWFDSPLFIFDDTLLHQSVNNTNDLRYCMFIDIMRPNYFPAFLNGIVTSVQVFLLKTNRIFYKHWDMLT